MKSNKSIGATLGYNLKDESQIIGVNNLEGEHVQDYEKQMKMTQGLYNGRAENLTIHVILSPHVEDGKKLTMEQWQQIASEFLKRSELDRHESLVFLHEDKEHKHLHLCINRADNIGNLYRNGNELLLSQRLGNDIAKDMGLVQAREVMRENKRLREQGTEPEAGGGSISKIRNDLKQAAAMAKGRDQNFDQEKFFSQLNKLGYEVKQHLNKDTGEIRGYGVGREGMFFNASQIGKDVTLKELSKFFSKERKEGVSVEDIRRDLKSVASKSRGAERKFNNERYFENLRRTGYNVKEHFNKDTGMLRGYGIEKNGVYYNASDLGKEFTLKNLKNMDREQQQQDQREYFQRANEMKEQRELERLKSDLAKENERLAKEGKITSTLKEMIERNLEMKREREERRSQTQKEQPIEKHKSEQQIEKSAQQIESYQHLKAERERKELEQLQNDLAKENERLAKEGKTTSTLKEMMEQSLEMKMKKEQKIQNEQANQKTQQQKAKGENKEQGISY